MPPSTWDRAPLMTKPRSLIFAPSIRLTVAFALTALSWPTAAHAAAVAPEVAWWVWPLALFLVCFVLGTVAVPAGIGGGVLFVPIVGGFFPFHLDFVRGAGLLVALASALAAGPALLRGGLADLRLGLPPAVGRARRTLAGARD